MPDQQTIQLPPTVQPVDFRLIVMQDENATVVTASAPWGTYATGSSKRAPNDPKDFGKAYRLAAARALSRLSRAILREENGRAY